MMQLSSMFWCGYFLLASLLPRDFANGFSAPRQQLVVADGCSCSGVAKLCHGSSRPSRKDRSNMLVLHAADNNMQTDDVNNEDDVQRPKEVPAGSTSNQSVSNVSDPSPTQLMSMMGTSPRRIFLSLASSTTIALATNFVGVTSNLLTALPEDTVEKSGLDNFYPRGDYKRATVRGVNSVGMSSNAGKCSCLIPKEWVADTSLALAQAQRQARALDYTMTQQQQGVLPDAAYGPPGRADSNGLSNADTNVSIIINNGVKNFSLASSLGSDPTEAAGVLLSSKFGPRKPTTLISAFEERRGENNIPVYQFEYTVNRGEKVKPLRAISVVAGSIAGDAFVTMTVVSLDEQWEKKDVNEKLRRVAESFKLV